MPNTPVYGLPYPQPSDTPDVPRDMQALALAVEADLDTFDAGAAAPTLRIRQNADQAFGTGVTTNMTWTPDPAYPAANAAGFLTYGTNSIVTARAGVFLAVLNGSGTGGRFSWRLLITGGNYRARGVGAADFNVASMSTVELCAAGIAFTANAFGYTSGTLTIDSTTAAHGMTVTYLGGG